MSIPVALPELAQTLARYRFAYLLTAGAQGAPHAVAVQPVLHGDVLQVDGVGRRTRDNVLLRPSVGLVWPPSDAGGHSLIVDGLASLAGERLSIRPERAVLHRPAPGAQ